MTNVEETSPIFKQRFLDWLDDPEHGFYVANTWDATKEVMGGRGKLGLRPFQRRILEHVLDFDPVTGKFPYTTVVYSTIKKSGKTTLGAAVGSWFAENAPYDTQVYIVANDLEQASSRVLKDMQLDCKLKDNAQSTKYTLTYPDSDNTVEALSKSYRSSAGSRHALTLWDELWGYCERADAEAYTKNGWKFYSDLSVGDVIATLNLFTNEWEWKPITKINVFDYEGELVHLKHRRHSSYMTPNHKVLGRFKTSGHSDFGELEFRKASEAMDSYEMLLPVATEWTGHLCKEWDDLDLLRLAGYYIAEGHKIPNCVSTFISQSNSIKAKKGNIRNKIQKTLDHLFIQYSVNKDGFRLLADNFENTLLYPIFGNGSENKHIPDFIKNLPTTHLSALFHAYMEGDGWVAGRGWQCESTSKQLIDDLVEIGIKIGYIAKYMGVRKPRTENSKPLYRASFSKGNIRIDHHNWETITYKGKVWCPTTSNSTWLMRSEGKYICWTGNSSEESRRLWDELQPIPTVPYSLRFITTYAGFYGESDLLWELYLAGVGTDEHPDGRGQPVKGLEDLPCWSNGRLFVYWDHEPRLPWQTEEYYEEMQNTERPASYLRLHKNRWVTSHEAFMPIEWWDYAVKESERLNIGRSADLWQEHPYRKAPVYVAVDAGIKRDCTAVVGVTYNPKEGKVILLFHKIWKPLKDQPIDLDTTLEPYLKKIWKEYNIKEIAFDPSQLLQTKKRLEKDRIEMYEFVQSGREMTNASQLLFDLFHDKHFIAYKDDEIREHLRNSVAEQTSAGLRIVKDKSNRRMEEKKVDAAVALAMACHRAVECSRDFSMTPIVFESPFSDLSDKRVDESQKNLPWPLQDN